MLTRFVKSSVFSACVFCVLGINARYLATLQHDEVWNWVETTFSIDWMMVVYLVWMFLGVPIVLLQSVRAFCTSVTSRRRLVRCAFFTAGIWINTLLVGVPALGAMPSLPSTLIVLSAGGDELGINIRIFAIYCTNLFAFTLIGWLLSLGIKNGAPENACRVCAYDLRGNESGICPECGTSIEMMPGAYHQETA